MTQHRQNNLNKRKAFKDAHFVSIYQTGLVVCLYYVAPTSFTCHINKTGFEIYGLSPLHRGVI